MSDIGNIYDPLGDYNRNPEFMDKHVSRIAEAEINLEQGYDPNDSQQVDERRRHLAREERERLDFIRKIMIMKSGRKWIYNFMGQCRTFDTPIVPNDVNMTYFVIGQQDIGKRLLADVEKHTELYLLMISENKI